MRPFLVGILVRLSILFFSGCNLRLGDRALLPAGTLWKALAYGYSEVADDTAVAWGFAL